MTLRRNMPGNERLNFDNPESPRSFGVSQSTYLAVSNPAAASLYDTPQAACPSDLASVREAIEAAALRRNHQPL